VSSRPAETPASGSSACRSLRIPLRAGGAGATVITFLVLAASAMSLHAQPFTPAQADQVLERLPATSRQNSTALQRLQAALRRNPEQREIAVELARRYIQLGHERADPRYAGYAQAALQPWWNQAEPPTDVLVLRAMLRQRRHAFTAALADLDRVLARDPRHAQARLSRASLHELRGDYAAAMRDCRALERTAPLLVAASCRASVAARSGKAREAFDQLETIITRAPARTNETWARTVLADIALQLGHAESERYLKTALALDPDDPYLLAQYADLLLEEKRFADVRELLAGRTGVDALLLRLALAEAGLRASGVSDQGQSAELRRYKKELAARFEAGRRRGDTVHLREEAIYQLHLQGNATAALDLARQNWNEQREPADAIILLEAALTVLGESASSEVPAAESSSTEHSDAKQAIQSLTAWLSSTKLEHARLAPLLAQVQDVQY
jgi:thioredoxin-like negative regulator of GroEL